MIHFRNLQTEILIATWVGCPISGFMDPDLKPLIELPADDPRAMIALARTNYLHSKYKIFHYRVRYLDGWRALSPTEKRASYIFWVEIGKTMGIKDIPDSLESLEAWNNAYEETRIVPTHRLLFSEIYQTVV